MFFRRLRSILSRGHPLDERKTIISIDDVFKNYVSMNHQTRRAGSIFPFPRVVVSSMIKCYARATRSTKELTRQRRGRSCRSKETKIKRSRSGRKKNTQRGTWKVCQLRPLISNYPLFRPSLPPLFPPSSFLTIINTLSRNSLRLFLRRHGG